MKFTRKLMLALAIVSAGVVTSCKDYDEDNYNNALISNGTTSSAALKAQMDALEAKVNQIKQCECSSEQYKTVGELAEALKGYFVTQGSLSEYVTGNNLTTILNNYVQNSTLGDYVQKSALADYVKTEALADYVTNSTLAEYVKQDQIKDFITAAALDGYVKQEDIKDFVTQTQLATAVNNAQEALNKVRTSLHDSINTNFESIKTINNQIIEMNKVINHADGLAKLDSIRIDNINDRLVLMGDSLKKAYDDAAAAKTKAENNALAISALQTKVSADSAKFMNSLADSCNTLRLYTDAALQKAKDYTDAEIKIVNELLKGKADTATVQALEEAMKQADAQLNGRIDSLKEVTKTLGERCDYLDKRIDSLVSRVDSLEDARAKQITGIIVQQVGNPVFGSYNSIVTNIQTNMLMAYYGEAQTAVNFPSCSPIYKKKAGAVLVGDEENNAGQLYITVNPTDIDYNGFTGFQLVNSMKTPCAITLGAAQEVKSPLTLGYTRAAGDAIYMVPAKLDASKVYDSQLNLNIDKSAIKDAVKDLIKVRNAAGAKVAIEDLAKVAQNVASELNSLQAQGIKCSWTDVYGEHNVYSNFNIGALAVKPLSFYALDDVNSIGIDKVIKALDKIKNKVDEKVINKVNDQLQEKKEELSQRAILKVVNGSEWGLSNCYVVTVSYNGNADVKTALEEINEAYIKAGKDKVVLDVDDAQKKIWVVLSMDEMNDMIAGLGLNDLATLNNNINKMVEQIADKFDLVLDKEEQYYGKLINILNKINDKGLDLLHKVLKPVVLVNDGSKIGLAGVEGAPSYVKSTNVALVCTTYNLETVSPCLKKYLVVNGQGKMLDSTTNYVSLKKGRNDITFYALDYTGKEYKQDYVIYAE